MNAKHDDSSPEDVDKTSPEPNPPHAAADNKEHANDSTRPAMNNQGAAEQVAQEGTRADAEWAAADSAGEFESLDVGSQDATEGEASVDEGPPESDSQLPRVPSENLSDDSGEDFSEPLFDTAALQSFAAIDPPAASFVADAPSWGYVDYATFATDENDTGYQNFEKFDPANAFRSESAATSDWAIDDLFLRPGERATFKTLPYTTDQQHAGPHVELLGTTSDNWADEGETALRTDVSPRGQSLSTPTADGGPPLARPIVLVTLPDEWTRKIIDDALTANAERSEKCAKEAAQFIVDDYFWHRDCEMRAILDK
jgi:hypothetical protein